jgi:hypothetical protein
VVAVSYRQWLKDSTYPWDVLAQLHDHFSIMPANGRAVLLKDGYLYADSPRIARALVAQVTAPQLFGHDQIWVQRGERIFHAERRKGNYYYTDGPLEGDMVRLLLFDRIGFGDPAQASPALHRDVRSLRYRLHFTRMQVRHITQDHIVALLKYRDRWVPTLLKSTGPHLDMECEITDTRTQSLVNDERETIGRRQRAVQVLRKAMLAEIDEKLPFDEPRHEYGMQFDGFLRRQWRAAYFSGKRHYNFNGDRYEVYDQQGRPVVPQVCVDFLTDTFERASGTWYTPRGETPQKRVGALDFGTEIEKPWLRRAPDFVNYVKEHGEWFETLDINRDDQIPLGEREALRSYLVGRARDFRPGDILIIKGYTPWDPKTMHYHSFFLYETDPLSGLPIALVGNTGRPSMRVWEREAKRTPKRAIIHRLRPRIEWMERIFAAQLDQVDETPATLTPSGAVD